MDLKEIIENGKSRFIIIEEKGNQLFIHHSFETEKKAEEYFLMLGICREDHYKRKQK